MNTKYWDRYKRGIDYISKKSLIDKTNRNWRMYSGDQWYGCKTDGEELPVLNFIQPTIKHKISTVSQNNMVAKYSDANGIGGNEEIYSKLNDHFSSCWEMTNMDIELWSAMKDSAVTGDGLFYFGTDNIKDMQRLDNTSILYGDENNKKIQQQPYLIIHQRLALGVVREIARKNNVPEEEIASIVPDQETSYTVGNTDEVDEESRSDISKVTCIIHMEKDENGYVKVCQCTQNVIIDPEHVMGVSNAAGEIVNGLTLYPIVKMSWEDYPNRARGLSEVEKLIPNQLELNKTEARRSIAVRLFAFPRIAYDENSIINPDDLDKVGAKIALAGTQAQSIGQLIAYLNPAQISSEPQNYANDLLEHTQELSGSGETAMGNINPNRVAASAIIAIRDQAALPLNEQVAKMKIFVEDLARLWAELWAVYNPNGFDVLSEETNEFGEPVQVVKHITAEELQNMVPEVRVDTSQDSPWTKEAMQNWLDGALDKQYLTFEEYIEASSSNSIVPKNQILSILEKRKQRPQTQQEIDPATYATQQWEQQDSV